MDLATKEESSASAASELQRQLRGGGFVVTAELTPPVSSDPSEASLSRLAGEGRGEGGYAASEMTESSYLPAPMSPSAKMRRSAIQRKDSSNTSLV